MSAEMAGKVAIVTGAARGLGRGIAELFVAEGGKVVIADLRDEEGEALAQGLGDAARYMRADVSDRDAMQALVDFTVREFGRLNVMVNNAGVTENFFGRLLDAEFAGFERLMQINVLGAMLGTQIAARQMAKSGGGSIVNISSIGGVRPGFGFFTYRTAKAGVSFFTKSAALELAEHNIRVNCICPGNVPTEMGTFATAPGEDTEKQRRIAEAVADVRMGWQPLKRQASPRDIAEAALWFGGNRSLQVTGQVLSVDGGATLGDTTSQIGEIMTARADVEAEFGQHAG
jgi:NAD(P)-dependent dehydrogenase (short-subunit alcohol dehydrogenase family)